MEKQIYQQLKFKQNNEMNKLKNKKKKKKRNRIKLKMTVIKDLKLERDIIIAMTNLREKMIQLKIVKKTIVTYVVQLSLMK
jgi:hypothetical protein